MRPFTVDNLVDRLTSVPESPDNAAEMLRFLWQLLARERQSEFGTRNCVERAGTFDPARWYWCQPGRPERGDAERDRQRRERILTGLPLPARDGQWRPAGTLAFGADWATWLAQGAAGPVTPPVQQRIDAYRWLDAVCPSDGDMLGSPDNVIPLLESGWVNEDDDSDPEEDEPRALEPLNAERHAFLLRLGVWEVIPVEGFEDRTRRDRRFPWEGPRQERQLEIVEEAGGWAFDKHRWGGQSHTNVFVSEDFRFRWPLGAAATRNALAVARLLEIGIGLYSELRLLSVFCPGCSLHQRFLA